MKFSDEHGKHKLASSDFHINFLVIFLSGQLI